MSVSRRDLLISSSCSYCPQKYKKRHRLMSLFIFLWAIQDSNLWPLLCKSTALPTELIALLSNKNNTTLFFYFLLVALYKCRIVKLYSPYCILFASIRLCHFRQLSFLKIITLIYFRHNIQTQTLHLIHRMRHRFLLCRDARGDRDLRAGFVA